MPSARAGASRTRAAPNVGRASTSRRNCYRRFITTASSRRFPSPSCTRTGRTPWSWRARASKEGGGATPRGARRTILLTLRASASRRRRARPAAAPVAGSGCHLPPRHFNLSMMTLSRGTLRRCASKPVFRTLGPRLLKGLRVPERTHHKTPPVRERLIQARSSSRVFCGCGG